MHRAAGLRARRKPGAIWVALRIANALPFEVTAVRPFGAFVLAVPQHEERT